MALPASPARVLFGKVVLVTVHAMLFSAIGAVGWLLISGEPPLASPSARRQLLAAGVGMVALLGTLLVMTWKGFGWARWITTLLLFTGGLIALTALEESGSQAKTLIVTGSLLSLVCAALLAFVPQVEDFIRDQERTRRLLK